MASTDFATSDRPPSVSADWTLVDLRQSLGEIPYGRIRAFPPPGTATEQHVLEMHDRTGRICELIDGVLVEKTMGYFESHLAAILIQIIKNFVDAHDLGIVLGEAGALKVLPDQVRVPDVSFLSWRHFPSRELPAEPIPAVAPDLAIEVLSKGNTQAEMERKLRDYFAGGVQLVWYIDPDPRTAKAYTSAGDVEYLAGNAVLLGREVLPGFKLPLADLFAKAGRRATAPTNDR